MWFVTSSRNLAELEVASAPPPALSPPSSPPPASPSVPSAAPKVALQSMMPEFPWPPPRASAWDVIPRDLLTGLPSQAPTTIGHVEKRLSAALESAGYYQRVFFSAPNGLALVTQMERFASDGAPAIERRWNNPTEAGSSFSLDSYLRRLLYADPGRYRLIVLLVTDVTFSTSDEFMTAGAANELAARGALSLDASVAEAPYTAAHQCTVLIYEFEKPRSVSAKLVRPSPLPGRVHLQMSRILSGFDTTQKKK